MVVVPKMQCSMFSQQEEMKLWLIELQQMIKIPFGTTIYWPNIVCDCACACVWCIPSSQLVASLFSEPVGISPRSSHIQPRQNTHSFQRSPETAIWMLSSPLMFHDNQPTDSTSAIAFCSLFTTFSFPSPPPPSHRWCC